MIPFLHGIYAGNYSPNADLTNLITLHLRILIVFERKVVYIKSE